MVKMTIYVIIRHRNFTLFTSLDEQLIDQNYTTIQLYLYPYKSDSQKSPKNLCK